MPNLQNITKIPSARVAFINPVTGLISREWFRFLNNIYIVSGGSTLGIAQIENGGTGGSTAAEARANIGAGTGTVDRVTGEGSVNGITLSGDVTTSGALTLGGAVLDVDLMLQTVGPLNLTTRASGTLRTANGGTGVASTTVNTKTTDFTVADTDQWVINNKTGSSCVVTLPDPTVSGGRMLVIKNIQSQTVVSVSSNVVPLNGGAAGTAILPATVGAWATLVSDGTNWVIMQS
jgi:hypothetical protein